MNKNKTTTTIQINNATPGEYHPKDTGIVPANKLTKNDNKVKKIAQKSVKQKKQREKTLPNLTLVRLCKNLNECDIDEVAKVILDMDKSKKYPDLSQ